MLDRIGDNDLLNESERPFIEQIIRRLGKDGWNFYVMREPVVGFGCFGIERPPMLGGNERFIGMSPDFVSVGRRFGKPGFYRDLVGWEFDYLLRREAKRA